MVDNLFSSLVIYLLISGLWNNTLLISYDLFVDFSGYAIMFSPHKLIY